MTRFSFVSVICAVVSLLSVASCVSTGEPPSLGDSPVHEIKCPNFEPWEMCVSGAAKKNCPGGMARLLSPSAEVLNSDRIGSHTVSVEGQVTRRTITIICDE